MTTKAYNMKPMTRRTFFPRVGLILLITVAAVSAKTCFYWAWPVTYRPIPPCPGLFGAGVCYKYIMNDEGYGFSCDYIADGAKACETVNAQITFDEWEGLCDENNNCQMFRQIYWDEPITGNVAHDVPCYGG